MALKRMLILLFIFIMVLMLSGCLNPFLPVYQRADKGSDSDADGLAVVIGGVTYSNKSPAIWDADIGNAIGYAGNYNILILEARRDTQRNFVWAHPADTEASYALLQRTDGAVPEPSAEAIYKINCHEIDSRTAEPKYSDTIITDKETIKDLFTAFENGEKVTTVSYTQGYGITLHCVSDFVPGATYVLDIRLSQEGKVICGDSLHCVEIPVELLEKLAGHQFDVQELLRDPPDDQIGQ